MMLDSSESGIEDLGVELKDLEDMTEDLADDMDGLEDEVGLWRQEGETEDLDGRSELKNWIILETEEVEDLETDIGDWVWVDGFLGGLTSGFVLVAAFL